MKFLNEWLFILQVCHNRGVLQADECLKFFKELNIFLERNKEEHECKISRGIIINIHRLICGSCTVCGDVILGGNLAISVAGPVCGNSVNRKAGGREWLVVCLLYLGNILKLSNQTYILFRLFGLVFNGITRVHSEITDLASQTCPKQKSAWSSSRSRGKSRANSSRSVR